MVDAPDGSALAAALIAAGSQVERGSDGLVVTGMTAAEVGRIALAAGVSLSKLTARQEGLEDVFLELVGEGNRS